jgi:hypothetical protein
LARDIPLSSKIHSVFIFLRSGENLVSVISPMVKLDQTLLTGLLTAIREFGHEAIEQEIRTIEAGDYRFHYDVLKDLVTVGLADSEADVLEVHAVLHSLNVLFLDKFQHTLKDWDGGTRAFNGFVQIVQQALDAHNLRYVADEQELTSAECLLSHLGEVLDVLLLNILIGSAIILCCDGLEITKLSECLDELLPFKIPHMVSIADAEVAKDILQSRKNQVQKTPTILGVTGGVYDLLKTPEHTDHYLFLHCPKEGGCSHQAPPNQLGLNIAEMALRLGDSLTEQGRLLEFQLKRLISELRAFISFRKFSPDRTLEDIQELLHLSPERFQLLVFLHEEFGAHTGPLSESLSDFSRTSSG